MSTEFASADYTAGQLNAMVKMLKKQAGEDGPDRFLRGELVVSEPTRLVLIDRTKPFVPAAFIGSDWTIWRGAKSGDGLKGEEEQDARSLAMTKIDFSKVLFTACLKEGEPYITGEEKLSRHMAANHVRLDAKVGQALLEEKDQATLNWLYTTFNITWFELPGTVLRGSDGDRCFLCLYRHGGGRWDWDYSWLGLNRSATDVSAVLGK